MAQNLCEVLLPQVKAILKYARERFRAKNLGEENRYVNLMGGRKLPGGAVDEKLRLVRDWVEHQGLGRYTHLVPGPLIRATQGKVLTHMPLATGSTYTHLTGAMKKAYLISKEMEDPDLELDLQGLEEPKWGNHSLRRHSDKVARESLPVHAAAGATDVTKQLIDYFYGWLLKEMNKDMQLHYAGLDRPARRSLARVSMYL